MPKTSLKSLNKKHWVVKRNHLNEFRPQDLGLQELRFFSVYLSKINPMDLSTRVVRFPIADFQTIMELGRLNMTHLKNVVDSLLTKVTGTPDENGDGIIRFQIFKRCKVSRDASNEWYVEIDAHDDALPLMFDFKSHYFKYELWNALRLKSKNQLRMYEILKQHEKIGHKVVSVKELREMLGIGADEYPRFERFKNDVLNVCQKALAEHTDISYIYEPHGKKGRGGKILELKFTITKNKDFVDPLSLSKFIDLKAQMAQVEQVDRDDDAAAVRKLGVVERPASPSLSTPAPLFSPPSSVCRIRLQRMAAACGNSFNSQEVEQLDAAIKTYYPEIYEDIGRSADRLSFFYKQAKAAYDYGAIKTSKYKYLLGIVKNSGKPSENRISSSESTGSGKKGTHRSKLQNYEGRKWDYEKLAQMENEYVDSKIAEK